MIGKRTNVSVAFTEAHFYILKYKNVIYYKYGVFSSDLLIC